MKVLFTIIGLILPTLALAQNPKVDLKSRLQNLQFEQSVYKELADDANRTHVVATAAGGANLITAGPALLVAGWDRLNHKSIESGESVELFLSNCELPFTHSQNVESARVMQPEETACLAAHANYGKSDNDAFFQELEKIKLMRIQSLTGDSALEQFVNRLKNLAGGYREANILDRIYLINSVEIKITEDLIKN